MFPEFFGWYQDARNNIFLAMEYLPGGDLGEYIRNDLVGANRESRTIITQLLNALKIMHEIGVVHGELKPTDVLIKSTSPFIIKLTDQGIGTSRYMAPEQLGYRPGDSNRKGFPKSAADVWAVGSLTYEIITGSLQLNRRALIDYCQGKITLPDPPMRGPNGASKTSTHFIEFLLEPDPSQRPSVVEALQHPWI
ncbi:kinase-like protein, partial [Morchella conica CCBAS932]